MLCDSIDDRVGAVPLTQAHLAARLAMARERSGISQTELAEQVSLTQSAISRIESGARGVDSLELAAISQALKVSVVDLLEERPVADELEIAARMTEVNDTIAVDAALSRVLDLLRLDRVLDDAGEPHSPPEFAAIQLPDSANPIEQGKLVAAMLRERWELGDDPLPPSLVNLVEQLSGLNVALEPMDERVAGLCACVDDFAVALIDSSVTYGRQRFTMAHELCHFVLRDGNRVVVDERLGGKTNTERRANAFAAYFLMPEQSIQRYIRGREVDGAVVVELQYTFGVSLDSLLWHLLNLGHITDYRRRELQRIGAKALAFRYGFDSDWQRLEAERGTTRPPTSLYQRALAAYEQGAISIEPLADLLSRRDTDRLRRDLADQGIEYEEQWWRETAPA